MRFASAWLVSAMLLAVPSNAHAAPSDYDAFATEWNGLSDFAALARAAGWTVVAAPEVQWDDVGPTDAVALLYPTALLEATHVAAYVRGGGRLLIADDFGRGSPTLARLGLLRGDAAAVRAARLHDGNAALPIATALRPEHPLARGAAELVTNHPAVFAAGANTDVVFQLGTDAAVVVAGALGDGSFVALSDPSVLINAMLAFDGNASFAANLLLYLLPAELAPGRLFLLTHSFVLAGTPPDLLDRTRALSGVNAFLRTTNRWLDGQNDWIAHPPTLRTLAAIGAIALLAAGLFALPGLRARGWDGAWTRPRIAGAVEGGDEALAARFAHASRWDDHALPAAILRDAIAGRLAELTGVSDPLQAKGKGAPAAELIAVVERRAGHAAASVLADALPLLAALPALAQLELGRPRRVGRRELERARDAVRAFERALGHG